ncbi:MAG: M42 family metallopeptidase [Xylanivirga thermophila]|jgi:tetrahedral aminopeptidase|uniref:M42 family metallopeptidase n=1 Tax=Xylanivirga thermophila TaxID=2496273 RepID=UPI00101D1AB4|nr:M42 family metallopeptidase [Xylanivirga thermophila]
MDSKDFLAEVIQIPGISGYEDAVADRVSGIFKDYCDDVKIDRFFNVYGKKSSGTGENRPKIMLAAHMDEIGLMVKDIDDDGFITFTNIGGVDQRILLSQEVIVHGKETLLGVIGAKPPHLQQGGEADDAVKMKDMAIDVAMPAEKVKELVTIGDVITFKSPLVSMQGSFVNGKSLDDRAGVAVMLETMKELDRLNFCADVYFVATVQEEVGTKGAIISAYNITPDVGIAIDVTHGDTPDASKDDTVSMTKGPAIAMGPNMHQRLTNRMIEIAKEYNIDYQVEVEPGPTGTDARSIQISKSGVPTLLMEIPLRYMHTTVETLNMDTVKDAARILALFIASLKEGWQEWLTY